MLEKRRLKKMACFATVGKKSTRSEPGKSKINPIINQSIIVHTPEIKSLLASLYKREEFPLFGKEGLGKILR
jgi:hypothetical protein